MKALEALAQNGFLVTCADRHKRMCYPIIAGFMADYEEQVLITQNGFENFSHAPFEERLL